MWVLGAGHPLRRRAEHRPRSRLEPDGLRPRAADADAIERRDLARTAEQLAAATHGMRVICHGDLHPFNLLVDGDEWTLIDWSTAVVADPHYDLAFTTLMLANPPLGGPAPVRAANRAIGTRLANRFLRSYEQRTGRTVEPAASPRDAALMRCAPSSRSRPGKPTTPSTPIADIPG
jgi:aminoglycoside phosphotransferase (APT) family kinase protein